MLRVKTPLLFLPFLPSFLPSSSFATVGLAVVGYPFKVQVVSLASRVHGWDPVCASGGGGGPESSNHLGCHGCSLGWVLLGDCMRVLCIEGLGGILFVNGGVSQSVSRSVSWLVWNG